MSWRGETHRLPVGAAALFTFVFGLACATPASAQQLHWDQSWERIHPYSYAIFPVLMVGSLEFDDEYTLPDDAWITGTNPLDEAIRDAFVLDDAAGRSIAADVSDVLLTSLMLWPIVDSVAVVGAGYQNSDVFWQLTGIAIEAAIADYALSTVVKLIVHRQRPHGRHCSREDRATERACGTRNRTRSFYSGHASAAFSSAGVVCVTHAHVPIYGSPAADATACGASLLMATTVSLLRVMADRHYLTDVLGGAVAGLITGALLPWLLHFREGAGYAPEAPSTTTDGLSAPLMLSAGGSW